jgi:hypothetical protein
MCGEVYLVTRFFVLSATVVSLFISEGDGWQDCIALEMMVFIISVI